MALDRTKVLDAAQKYVAKGQIDKAIAEYQRIVREDPNDVRTWLKIGDLYTKKGAAKEAAETYKRVAQHYGEQGFHRKAVAVYKQILKLDPNQADVALELGRTYNELGLMGEALETYQELVTQYSQSGNSEGLMLVLQTMVDIDGQNVPSRVRYAEALSKANRLTEAVTEFKIAADLLKHAGRIDEYIKVAERLFYHQKDDSGIAKELARVYIQRKDPQRALAKLQVCFKTNPRDLETLELLAEAFAALGQSSKTASVYHEVARLQEEQGRKDDRIRTLQRILEINPDDIEAKKTLASLPKTSTDLAKPATEASAAKKEADKVVPIRSKAQAPTPSPAADLPIEDELSEEELIEDDDMLLLDEEETSKSLPGNILEIQAALKEVQPQIAPNASATEASIARLLSESEVYVRYGLKSKIIEQYKRILDLDPQRIEVRERLKALYVTSGKTAEAIRELLHLARLTASKPQLSNLYLREILELDPSHTEARDLLDALTVEMTEEPADDAVIIVDEDEPGDAPLAAKADAKDALARPQTQVTQAEQPSARSHAQKPASPALPAAKRDVEPVLEEVDFFLAQGSFLEAQKVLQEALAQFPNHPLLVEKQGEISEVSSSPSASTGRISSGSNADQTFALAEKLAEEFDDTADPTIAGSSALDVEQIFSQFKKGVAEQITDDDTDTHFDLGIAYKEMGLFEDAVGEFQLSMRSKQRECSSYMMIGLCHMERGDVAEAISHFKKGLYAEARTEREELGLYFELGAAYERLRDFEEALYYYDKVQKRDATFRNVEKKIRELSSHRRGPSIVPPAPDEIDDAFDALIDDKNQ